jgi:putative aldouronate transport system substrate-binding protein
MRKIFVIFMCLCLGVPLFAGGASGGTASGGAAKSGLLNPRGKLPLADGKTTLTMFLSPASSSNRLTSASVEDNIFTQKVARETGINLEIEWGGLNTKERVNILLSTGTYPDIVINGFNRNDLLYYASQGIFIPLNKYDPQGFPNIGEGFKNFPWLTRNLGDADGNIYSLPYVNECIMCVYGNGRGWFFNPWIRGTNRKVPETLDEFTEFLRYVKNTDLNKNGKKDEIPMAFSAEDLYNVITFFADAYMPFNGTDYFGLAIDGKRS